jgi:hypothetical protein
LNEFLLFWMEEEERKGKKEAKGRKRKERTKVKGRRM